MVDFFALILFCSIAVFDRAGYLHVHVSGLKVRESAVFVSTTGEAPRDNRQCALWARWPGSWDLWRAERLCTEAESGGFPGHFIL